MNALCETAADGTAIKRLKMQLLIDDPNTRIPVRFVPLVRPPAVAAVAAVASAASGLSDSAQ